MIRISRADDLLLRWVRLHEQLSSPRAASGVLHSGLQYAQQCARCESRSWTPKAVGRQLQRTYHPVCVRCGRDWPVFVADIRMGQVSCGRGSSQERRHDQLALCTRILGRVPLWELRVWSMRVLGAGGTYEDLAQDAARRWGRKHASVPGGWFSGRHCRTLVGRAREIVEDRARRAGIWEDIAA